VSLPRRLGQLDRRPIHCTEKRGEPARTGLAQVSGRQPLDFADRFALDVRYVNWSLGLDLPILLLAVQRVVGGCGVGPPAAHEPDPDGALVRGENLEADAAEVELVEAVLDGEAPRPLPVV
jgi:hypothetical protein